MAQSKRDRSLGDGVYYAAEDYVSLTQRLIILAIDIAVLFGVLIVFVTVNNLLYGNTEQLSLPIFWLCLLTFWAYLTIMKSTTGTVGYWSTGAKIVNLRGQPPSIWRMSFRLLLWVLGPFNLFFDLGWCTVDNDRQTLRDRFAGTYVIKRDSVPTGTGEIHLSYYHAMGLTLMFPWVTRPKHKRSTAQN